MLHKIGEFATNPEEIRPFLGVSYIMSISKLPNVNNSIIGSGLMIIYHEY